MISLIHYAASITVEVKLCISRCTCLIISHVSTDSYRCGVQKQHQQRAGTSNRRLQLAAPPPKQGHDLLPRTAANFLAGRYYASQPAWSMVWHRRQVTFLLSCCIHFIDSNVSTRRSLVFIAFRIYLDNTHRLLFFWTFSLLNWCSHSNTRSIVGVPQAGPFKQYPSHGQRQGLSEFVMSQTYTVRARVYERGLLGLPVHVLHIPSI